MKYKTNFVTNSSSSSFVIGFSVKKYTEEDLKKFPELQFIDDFLENLFLTTGGGIGEGFEQTEEGYLFETENDVWAYVRQYEGDIEPGETGKQYYERLNEDNYKKIKYSKILQKIKEGKKLIIKEISYHDRMHSFMEQLRKQKIIEIIDEEEM